MSDSIEQHIHIVFGGEHYNPLGIVRTLGEYGILPDAILISSQRQITSKSKYLRKTHFVESIDEGLQLLLNEYGNEELKPFVYSSDDQVASLLDKQYNLLVDKFYFFNAGKANRLNIYMDKYHLCELAEKHGIPLAKTWVVDKGIIPNDIRYPVITKAIISTLDDWKKDSFICKNEDELTSAYTRIRSPKVLLQQYITKKNELCLDGFCISRGEKTIITIASTYNYTLPDTYSPYMTVTSFENTELKQKICDMFRDIGFEGIFSMEFLIGPEDELYFLEINFRNSTWSYASTRAKMPLPVMWAEGMIGGLPEKRVSIIERPFCAMVEFDDFRYRVRQGNTSIFRWMKDVRNCECTYYYNAKDKKPFFSYIFSKLK